VTLARNRFEGNAQLLKQKAVAAPSHNAASEETVKTASNVGIPMCQTDKTATFNGKFWMELWYRAY